MKTKIIEATKDVAGCLKQNGIIEGLINCKMVKLSEKAFRIYECIVLYDVPTYRDKDNFRIYTFYYKMGWVLMGTYYYIL